MEGKQFPSTILNFHSGERKFLQKRKKQSGGAQKKRALLAACVSAALLYATPAHAALRLYDEANVTHPNIKVNNPTGFTIASGETWRTYFNAATGNGESSATKYTNITIQSGGIWQPLDSNNLINVEGTLTLEKDAVLDLSYKYGPENYPANDWTSNQLIRMLKADTANSVKTVFHDGAILRVNMYSHPDIASGALTDRFLFKNPQLGDDAVDVKVQIRYNKSFGGPDLAAGVKPMLQGSTSGAVITLSAISDEVKAKIESGDFTFTGESSYIDSSLNKYLFTPTLTASEVSGSAGNYKQSYGLNWAAIRSDLVSQGVFSAANAQLSMRNLWRMEDGLFWKRGEELRAANRLGQSEGADGAWGQIWRGKYDFAGAYGSDFDQSYNGIQVGYDKQRERDFYGGRLHTGLFLSMLNADANFHQTDDGLYSRAHGDLESKGIGLYTAWQGDKGHYFDFTVRGSKLSNKYKFSDSDDNLYNNDYSTWTYGAGLRYGFQKELPNGWYLEPQAGLTYGTMKSYSYMQDNGMRYRQEQVDMLTGRLGVTAGRHFGSGGKRGVLYAKAAVNHDFKDGGSAYADAMMWSQEVNGGNGGYKLLATLPVNTLAGKDTWYDFAIGANLQTGKDQTAFLELSKTAGGKVNTDWQVNTGLSWRFNGPSHQEHAAAQTAAFDRSMNAPAAGASFAPPTPAAPSGTAAAAGEEGQTAATGQATDVTGTDTTVADGSLTTPADQTADQAANKIQVKQEEPAGQEGQAGQTEQTTTRERGTAEAGFAFSAGTPANGTAQTMADGDPGSYTLAPLVVEAARPDWEKKLSPGTVSVIHVPEYKGEMKNLPDLLQTVPGVYIQRLQGTGHYTVARVRGSTGGQVNIYMDGVLVNSSADSAVDLSIIPIENVERIEVYRGYVPARFAGAPIGGAINIVTKKPQDVRGSVTQGMRSFGGYTGNLELTAPVGSGSMLFAVNRDQAKGDFRYTNLYKGAVYEPPTQDRHRQYNDYQNTDALLKWQDDNWFAKLTWQKNTTSFPESTNIIGADVPDDELASTPHSPTWFQYRARQLETTKSEFQFGRRQTAANLEWGWKLGTSYQLKEAASSQTKNWDNSAFLTVDNEFRDRRYEGSIDGSWQASKSHLVEFLFSASRETMDVSTSNAEMWPPAVDTSGNLMGKYANLFKPHYENKNYHFQVQDTMTLNRSGSLFFTPVLRAQKMDMDIAANDPDMNSWKYSYGLGLKKVQNEHWTFRGTYGTYYKFPTWYELFGDGVNVKSRWEKYSTVAGTPQYLLDNYVERGTSWDVSANWQGKALNADSDITLTYFNRDAKNLASYSLDFYGFGYYTNLAAGNIQGVELESKMNWGRWDLLLAATWNDSVVTASGSKDTLASGPTWMAGRPFPWIPEWEYNARLGYRFPGDKLSAFAEYHYLDKVANWGTSESGSTTYDALGITNVGVKYDLNRQVKLTAGVNDLLNKGPNQVYHLNSEVGNVQYPQQGRTYYLTAQYFY